MLEALGALLLLFCAQRLGTVLCRYYEKQYRITCAFGDLVREMQEQIAKFRTPFEGILNNSTLCRLLDTDAPPTFSALLEKSRALLPEDAVQALSALEGELGKHFYNEQLDLLARALAQIDKARTALQEQLPRRKRLARALPIAAALAVILLLI